MRGLVRFLVVLVVVAALAVVGDRVAAYVAGQETAKALGSALGSSAGSRPTVEFGGFPFLTQWATGDYRRITVSQRRATVAGTTFSNLQLTLTGVHTPAFLTNNRTVLDTKVGTANVRGTVAYAELPLPAGIDAARSGHTGNRIKLSGKVDVLGRKVPVDAVVAASLRGGDVRLKPQSVHVGGKFASRAATRIVRDTLDLQVTPPGLPDGVTLTSMQVTDAGIRVGATGHDIALPGR